MDRLAMESTAAWEAGMSYGRWKAMQKPDPVKEESKKDKPLEEGWHTCACCGNLYYHPDKRNRKYCGDDCRKKMYNRQIYEWACRKGKIKNPRPSAEVYP